MKPRNTRNTRKNETTPAIPGFVDLQINGYQGVDFSRPDLTVEGVESVAGAVRAQGTAAFLHTVVTAAVDSFRRNLPILGQAVRSESLQGCLLGLHIEGPWISPETGFVGAHNQEYVIAPDPDLLREMWKWSDGTLRLLTLAAELPGASELVACAAELSIAVSIGHSNFDDAGLQRIVDAGATGLTHLGNGLAGVVDRHRNPIWSGLANDDVTAMIIPDGFHLPPALIKTILRAKGVERTIVVSDVSALGGLDPGEYFINGNPVVLERSGRIRTRDANFLAGSSLTMLPSMNHLASLDLLSVPELLAIGFYNPLRFIGVEPQEITNNTGLIVHEESKPFSLP